MSSPCLGVVHLLSFPIFSMSMWKSMSLLFNLPFSTYVCRWNHLLVNNNVCWLTPSTYHLICLESTQTWNLRLADSLADGSRLQVSTRRKDHLAGGETMVPYGAKSHACENYTCEIMWEKLGIQTVLQERGPVRTRTLADWWKPGGEVWELVTAEKYHFWGQPVHVVGFDATLHDRPLDVQKRSQVSPLGQW